MPTEKTDDDDPQGFLERSRQALFRLGRLRKGDPDPVERGAKAVLETKETITRADHVLHREVVVLDSGSTPASNPAATRRSLFPFR